MDIKEAIKERHSVRQYSSDHIMGDVRTNLETLIQECNKESGLHIQLITQDPECFDTLLGHYGSFSGVDNYIAIVGSKKMSDLEELGGYYGEKIVLEAQIMGLNTCWVAGTYGKGKCKAHVDAGEKIVCVIAIGYGLNKGNAHKSKDLLKLCSVPEKDMPAWFREGIEAALLAPTAMNQQKFTIGIDGEEAVIKAGFGPFTKLDLGIVRYNFEVASGHKCRAI
ncbi:nitroreductase family protein [Butyrivibrio sp.]|uniref:nitroreductase family protein n=1 Tax=Butyrivibrio sp. TaxID=28121 RepID=UPI0025BAEE73|nr:nitroreductase family protein [Butyrivibrio sp.]MBQ9302433.1 nitroreductase [Butyrivibrio sp.]